MATEHPLLFSVVALCLSFFGLLDSIFNRRRWLLTATVVIMALATVTAWSFFSVVAPFNASFFGALDDNGDGSEAPASVIPSSLLVFFLATLSLFASLCFFRVYGWRLGVKERVSVL
ncbi:uncharacterized protein DS421_4g121240 [Arachis hypogaea]|nr:uncharacterized protein DS421_4g121240 [Arachis hypogaea]